MRKHFKFALKTSVVCLLLICVGWAGAEIFGQLYFGNPYHYDEQRFLYTTRDAFRKAGQSADSTAIVHIVFQLAF